MRKAEHILVRGLWNPHTGRRDLEEERIGVRNGPLITWRYPDRSLGWAVSHEASCTRLIYAASQHKALLALDRLAALPVWDEIRSQEDLCMPGQRRDRIRDELHALVKEGVGRF